MADWKKIFDDAVEQIGEAAATAGEGLRQAAGEAGKVVGIGVGTIELRLDRGRTYRLGEWITGMVVLELAEPVAAKELTVTLRATRKRRVVVEDGRRGRAPRTAMRDEVVYEFICDVGGEQTYQSGELYFSLEIPPELESTVEVGGLLGDALRAARAVKSMTERPLRWRLTATLEIPWKRNLSTGIDLSVREDSVGPMPEPPRRASTCAGAGPGAPKATSTAGSGTTSGAAGASATASPTPEPKPQREPLAVPEPVAVPQGWGVALQRLMGQMLATGWETIHQWGPPPVDPAVVRDALVQHPDLDPDILMFYSMMDGIELVFGRPAAPRHEYETIRRAQEAAAQRGGPLSSLDEIWMHGELGAALEAEFSPERGGEVRVLEIPSLCRLLDDSEDFPQREGRNVIFGRIVLGYGDYFGIVRADEIRRWRDPPAEQPGRDGYYDGLGRIYQQRLREREQERPGAWWVVRGEDHGATLSDPPVLLRWSEMLAVCVQHLETGRP